MNSAALSNLQKLHIKDGSTVHYGGDQAWFAAHWQRQAGCGPTNCANLLHYMAATNANCAALCPYDASEKHGFVQLMNDVWRYVTPGSMGVNSTKLFTSGAVRYAKDKGVSLSTSVLNIAPLSHNSRSYTAVSSFITNALENDHAVAFLNLSNGTLQSLESWHWTTIVALNNNKATIYDQGRVNIINLRQWLKTSRLGGGFVQLTIEN